MDTDTQRQRAEAFRSLHSGPQPLVLVNAWDVASAKAIAKASPAIATSSGAVAASLGFADGENVPIDLVAGLVARMTSALERPVSIDLEAGYGDTADAVATSVRAMLEAGAVGINLEDGLRNGQRGLVDAAHHLDKIKAARCVAQGFGVHLFINARTDPFLLKFGSPQDCLAEAERRAALYADAGADGIFVPGLTDPASIERLARATPLPLNVMVMDASVGIPELAQAGARRISLGPWPMMATMRAVSDTVAAVFSTRRFGGVLNPVAA